jgi:hypothetical protein
MARTVLLPQDIGEGLSKLVLREEEVQGVLLFVPDGDNCPVECLVVTGIGNEGFVKPLGGRSEILNKFLKTNPDYRVIEFHTHTVKTVADCGDYFAENFSQHDIESMTAQMNLVPDYIAMLVTPKTYKLKSLDEVSLKVVDTPAEYYERKEEVIGALDAIAKGIGYEIEVL